MFGVAVACPQVDALKVDDDLWRVDVSVTIVDGTCHPLLNNAFAYYFYVADEGTGCVNAFTYYMLLAVLLTRARGA